MRLTNFTDFALRVLMHASAAEERWLTVAETSRVFGGLSEDHIAKVVRDLGKLGWLEVRRGRGGGFRLAHDPKDIVIGEVVRATEPDFHLVECFNADRNQCPATPFCSLTSSLNQALEAFHSVLDGLTLADIVNDRVKAKLARF